VSLDEPVNFGGRGESPDPAEYLLAAAGASLSVTLTAHAALRGVELERVHVALRGEIDARPFFRPEARVGLPGVLNVEITLTVSTPAPRAAFREVLKMALAAAPVLRSLKRMPRVRVVHERRPARPSRAR
jgi:uncharacterized OsmC-like protein